MIDKTVTDDSQSQRLNGVPTAAEENAPASTDQRPEVRYASDEVVNRASEKVFRLHTRLLAELAK